MYQEGILPPWKLILILFDVFPTNKSMKSLPHTEGNNFARSHLSEFLHVWNCVVSAKANALPNKEGYKCEKFWKWNLFFEKRHYGVQVPHSRCVTPKEGNKTCTDENCCLFTIFQKITPRIFCGFLSITCFPKLA